MRQTARPVPHIRLRFDHRPRHNLPLGALPVHGARGYVQQVFRRPVIEPQPPRLHTIGFPESDQTESFTTRRVCGPGIRSEEHTSELQSLAYLVCRLLLEKKKKPPDSFCMAPPLEA